MTKCTTNSGSLPSSAVCSLMSLTFVVRDGRGAKAYVCSSSLRSIGVVREAEPIVKYVNTQRFHPKSLIVTVVTSRIPFHTCIREDKQLFGMKTFCVKKLSLAPLFLETRLQKDVTCGN
jgi:hypothetical protein